MEVSDLSYFVDDVTKGADLGFNSPTFLGFTILCFFLKIRTMRKFASLEPLVGFLAFVIWKLWPKK